MTPDAGSIYKQDDKETKQLYTRARARARKSGLNIYRD